MFPPNLNDCASAKVTSFLAPVTRRYSAGHLVPAHAHAWPQLLYASSGVMRVETSTGSWIVPPQRAVWLPPNSVHETRMLTDVHLASLYLRTEKWSFDCEVMEISPLLRELIVAALQIDPAHKPSRRESLITDLIVEELRAAPRGLSPIPLPVDPAPACAMQKRHCESCGRRLVDGACRRGRKHVQDDLASVSAGARDQFP